MLNAVYENVLVPFGHLFYIVDPKLLIPNETGIPPNFIDQAIPFFFLLIFLEAGVSIYRKSPAYNLEEAICSISLGIVQQTFNLLLRYFAAYPYTYVYHNFRMFNIPMDSIWTFVAMLFLMDFGYYWMHRMAHEFHIMWLGHSVHHSGEYYNLATALRQGSTQGVFSRFFYVPLALLGFHPFAYVGHDQLNTLYQFWIHTDQIGKLGMIELVFNTPSHHRVHHRPPGNCNYAGVFIIWDRMFGTFKEEKQKRDFYGLGNQLSSYNPLYAHYQHAIRMLNIDLDDSTKMAVRNTTFPLATLIYRTCELIVRRRVHHPMVFKPSALLADMPLPLPKETGSAPPGRVKFGSNIKIPVLVRLYSLVYFVITVLQTLSLFKVGPTIGYGELLIRACVSCLSLLSVSMLNEGHRLASRVESCRVGLLTLTLLVLAAFPASGEILRPYIPFSPVLTGNQYFWAAQIVSTWWVAVYSISVSHFKRCSRKSKEE